MMKNIQRFKARLVARDFKQTAGVDYHETFNPITRFDSIRTILSHFRTKCIYSNLTSRRFFFIQHAATEGIQEWN